MTGDVAVTGPVRLTAVHGGWAGRLERPVAVGVPSPTTDAEALVVTSGNGATGDQARWNRIDVGQGTVRDSNELGPTLAWPTAVSDDGDLVAFYFRGACSLRHRDGTLRWKRRGGWMVRHFRADGGGVLADNPQGVVAELDTRDGAVRWQHRGREPMATDRRGRHVAAATLGPVPALFLYDRDDARVVATWPVSPMVVAVMPTGGDVVCAGAAGGRQRLCRLRAGSPDPVWTAPLPDGVFPMTLAVSADRDEVLLVTTDGLLRRHDAGDGAVRDRQEIGRGRVTFDRDGRAALVVRGNTCRAWTPDGGLVGRRRSHTSAVRVVACSPDGGQIASADLDHVRLWDGRDAVTTASGGGPATLRYAAHGALLLGSHLVGPHRAWHTGDGAPAAFPYPALPAVPTQAPWPEMVHDWAVSPDERLLWVQTEDRTGVERRLLRRSDGEVLWRHPGGGPVAFTADEVVTTVWVLGTGHPVVCRLPAADPTRPPTLVPLTGRHGGPAQRLRDDDSALSPDGRYLAVAAGDTIRLFDARDGRTVATTPARGGDRLLFAGDLLLATAHRRDSVLVFEVPGLHRRGEIGLGRVGDEPTALAVSADARVLAVGTHRGVVLRFAVEQRQHPVALGGPRDPDLG